MLVHKQVNALTSQRNTVWGKWVNIPLPWTFGKLNIQGSWVSSICLESISSGGKSKQTVLWSIASEIASGRLLEFFCAQVQKSAVCWEIQSTLAGLPKADNYCFILPFPTLPQEKGCISIIKSPNVSVCKAQNLSLEPRNHTSSMHAQQPYLLHRRQCDVQFNPRIIRLLDVRISVWALFYAVWECMHAELGSWWV